MVNGLKIIGIIAGEKHGSVVIMHVLCNGYAHHGIVLSSTFSLSNLRHDLQVQQPACLAARIEAKSSCDKSVPFQGSSHAAS